MNDQLFHSWNVKPKEAVDIQNKIRKDVVIGPLPEQIQTVAGTDISFEQHSNTAYAGITLFRLPDLVCLAYSLVITKTPFPYVPGLLSFREVPPLLEAWKQLPYQPDAVIMDGHGIAHPRRCGLACHFGLQVELPAIGCAKNILIGTFDEPAQEKGAHSPLMDGSEQVGYALRMWKNVKPVYVSPGHLCDFDGANDLVCKSTNGYKLPEPTRQADFLVNQLREGKIAEGLTQF